jgi:translation initiation factor IF-3
VHKKPFIYLNEKVLKLPEVHLIDDSGSSLGTMTSRQALNLAREKDLDLFVVSTTATPPIAKILNYGQYKYLENKRNKENSKPKQDTKELKISPRIQKHDIDTIIKKAIAFLQHGDKVRLTCVFKAREISFPTIGEEKIKLMLDELSEYGSTADVIELKGKLMSVLMNPKK